MFLRMRMQFKHKINSLYNKSNKFLYSNNKRPYPVRKSPMTLESVMEILNTCQLEPKIGGENSIRAKYCPLCPKPHNEDPTNLNTFILFPKTGFSYRCYRCGQTGHFLRLIKMLKKRYDLSKYNHLIRDGYASNGGTTTENEDYENKQDYAKTVVHNEESMEEKRTVYDPPSNMNESRSMIVNSRNTSFDNRDFKISLNSSLVNELYKRNLLLENDKCSVIVDYLLNERKLKLSTLKFYKVGASFEKFKNNAIENINLPCITFPMFYPVDKFSYLTVDKNSIGEEIFNHYNCSKYYLSRFKVRAIGREFKHFQRTEPSGAVVWGLFGIDTIPDDAEEIIITEGEYDAMAAYQETGIPSVSLPNGATNLPNQLLPYFERFKKIYLWMDADQAGQNAADIFSKKLGDNKTLIVNTRKTEPHGPKDANDALKMQKNLCDYLNNAKTLCGDSIIKMSDIKSEVIQFLSQYERFSGYKSNCFNFFNKKLKGLRMGEFSILTGETGSGKTTFLTQLSLDFIEQRIPTLWGSFEIKNDKLASMFLMQHAKKNLRLTSIKEIEYYSEQFEKFPLYMLKFHGSQSIDEVINSMNFAVYNHDIQNIVLDNLQFMMGSPSKYQTNKFDQQDEIIHKLRNFATEKNIHLTLVIHPRKDDVLKISSIFGTGKASQEADNIYILQSYKNVRILEIAKNRFDGTTGKVALAFDNETCRFFEMTADEFERYIKGASKVEDFIKERIAKFGMVENINNREIDRNEDITGSLISNIVTEKELQSSRFGNKKFDPSENIINNVEETFIANKNQSVRMDKSNSKESLYVQQQGPIASDSKEKNFNYTHEKVKTKGDKIIDKKDKDNKTVKSESESNDKESTTSTSRETNKDRESTEDMKNINMYRVVNEVIDESVAMKEKDKEKFALIEKSNEMQTENTLANDNNDKLKRDTSQVDKKDSQSVQDNPVNKILYPLDENTILQTNEVISQIKNFQENIFPEINSISTFHDEDTYSKTQSYNQRNQNINRYKFESRDRNKVRQSSFSFQSDNKSKVLDDVF